MSDADDPEPYRRRRSRRRTSGPPTSHEGGRRVGRGASGRAGSRWCWPPSRRCWCSAPPWPRPLVDRAVRATRRRSGPSTSRSSRRGRSPTAPTPPTTSTTRRTRPPAARTRRSGWRAASTTSRSATRTRSTTSSTAPSGSPTTRALGGRPRGAGRPAARQRDHVAARGPALAGRGHGLGSPAQLDGADDARLALFLEEYGDGHTAPEFGVAARAGRPTPGRVPEEGTNA